MAKLFRVIDEYTWLSCTVPRHLLRYLKDNTTERKLRSWACAATAHRYAQDEGVLAGVALLEAWADGESSSDLKSHARSKSAWEAAYEGTLRTLEKLPSSEKKNRYTEFQLAAVHEIFGNPFRPVVFDPRSLTPTVISLVRSAYRALLPTGHLDPARLAVLADARWKRPVARTQQSSGTSAVQGHTYSGAGQWTNCSTNSNGVRKQ